MRIVNMKLRKNARWILALIISYLPLNVMRCGFYKLMFGYTIRRSQIGAGTVILVDSLQAVSCTLGRFNRIIGPMRFIIDPGGSVGSHNTFICGDWTQDAKFADRNYERTLDFQSESLVMDHHFIDVAGSFVLGSRSWIAGRDSQFWTHGAGVTDRNILIGESCYIGSAVRFAPELV